MEAKPRIALIHATRLAIDPIETAAKEIWPDAEFISILDEGLSVDRSKSEGLTAEMSRRIVDLSRYAEAMASDGILFTCSAFGTAIDRAAFEAFVPVLKPNEAMFEAALDQGNRVAMIYTFQPAATGMEEEFRKLASARNSDAKLRSYFCEGALSAKQAGNENLHSDLIAETASKIQDAEVIILAQFSMASAADVVRTRSDVPVLTSPETAVLEIKRRIEAS